MKRNRACITALIVVGSIIVTQISALFLGVSSIILPIIFGKEYATEDLSLYGEVVGNYDNETPKEFIHSFFPEKIEERFQNPSYSYLAKEGDSYACEMVLEFTVKTDEEYAEVLNRYTKGLSPRDFAYAPGYVEYVISDDIRLHEPDKSPVTGEEYAAIGDAKIGKILCCKEERRFVFVAICVRDGGVAGTDYLHVFFDRFDIVPWEYEQDLRR